MNTKGKLIDLTGVRPAGAAGSLPAHDGYTSACHGNGCHRLPPTPVEATATALPALPHPAATLTATPAPSSTPNPTMRFAVIGDFGDGGQGEADVAALVHSWTSGFHHHGRR